MIFRRRKKSVDEVEEVEETETDDTTDEAAGSAASADTDAAAELSETGIDAELAALDEQDWRADGPFDVTEVDLGDPDDPDAEDGVSDDELPRIDLGSLILTGFAGAELRLQVAEENQQIVSAMFLHGDSALELGAYAAPRTGGFWPELREELAEATTEAGGSVALVEGPFGVELRRLMPVTTPDGEQGYQPSRMWVVEGPRWLLRGILYGEAALEEGTDGPVAELLEAFRATIVRRDDQAMAPGDLLPLQLPADLTPVEDSGQN